MRNILEEKLSGKELTPLQQKIANYCVENQLSICQQSLLEVAKAIGVSDVTVLRFARILGFAGYTDFKAYIYKHITGQANGHVSALSPSERLEATASIRRDIGRPEAFSGLMVENVEHTMLQNDAAVYQAAMNRLKNANTVYILGMRSTRGVAQFFARTLRPIKDRVILIDFETDVYDVLRGAGEQDVLIFLCTARFYKTDEKICSAAQTAGVPICMITDTLISPISKYATHLLIVRNKTASFFSSTIGLAAICEYLLTLLGEEDEAGIRKRLQFSDSYRRDERFNFEK